MERRRRVRRVALAIAGSLGALVLAIVGAGLWAAYTDGGRAHVARSLSDAINAGMRGTIAIGRISALGLTTVRAHDVVFRDPNGDPAIEVTDTTVTFDPLQVVRGAKGFDRADIAGCLVHVTEGKGGKVNMDETFAARPTGDESSKDSKADESAIDLRDMHTVGCELVIGGGSLPPLRLVDLTGTMRVYVAPEGKVELRFDHYRGRIVKGLPTGQLDFEDVRGRVQTRQKQLLSFTGRGRSEGAKVSFTLDIATAPKKRVKIAASFPELSLGAARAMFVSAYTSFSSTIELDVDAM